MRFTFKVYVLSPAGALVSSGEPRERVALEEGIGVFREVAKKHNLPTGAITGPSRAFPLVNARAEVALRLRNELNWPLKMIAFLLGNRHHPTIISLLRRGVR